MVYKGYNDSKVETPEETGNKHLQVFTIQDARFLDFLNFFWKVLKKLFRKDYCLDCLVKADKFLLNLSQLLVSIQILYLE